jgi:hypothetical protein
VGVGAPVGVLVGVRVGVGMAGVDVARRVAVAVGVGLWLDSVSSSASVTPVMGVTTLAGVEVAPAVAVDVAVDVAVGVGVAVGEAVVDAVAVGDADAVAVGVSVSAGTAGGVCEPVPCGVVVPLLPAWLPPGMDGVPAIAMVVEPVSGRGIATRQSIQTSPIAANAKMAMITPLTNRDRGAASSGFWICVWIGVVGCRAVLPELEIGRFGVGGVGGGAGIGVRGVRNGPCCKSGATVPRGGVAGLPGGARVLFKVETKTPAV